MWAYLGVLFLLTQTCLSISNGSLDRFTLKANVDLPYYHTYSLNGSAEANRAVIVIHGTKRNAIDYFNTMVKVANHSAALSSTIIIAPRFQTSKDSPQPRDAVWTNGDITSWKDGGNSVSPENTEVSSYEAIDEIMRALGDKGRFPSLTHIVIVGHSAGGQFVQRYVAGGRALGKDAAKSHVKTKFIMANPSSYMYFDAQRPLDTKSCPEYNNYKYGLDERNEYMARASKQELRTQYASRRVTYLLGTADVNQDHDIDSTCSAKVQGTNRLERGKEYYKAIKRTFPSAPHDQVDVPGVGHDHDAMFDSVEGRTAIFGRYEVL